MRLSFLAAEEGQSLVLAAGAFAMLLGAVAVSIDWGYSFAERRAMTNAAQAGALAAGRLLASSAVVSSSTVVFDHPQEDIYVQACTYAQNNLGSPIEPSTYSLTVQFLDPSGAQQAAITRTITRNACNAPGTSTSIPSATRDIRATVNVSYPSLFGSIAGTPTIAAAGSARSRIGGAPVTALNTFNNGTPWPMARHYDPNELVNTCGNPCNPTTATPVEFWGNISLGSFKGLIDFSRYSQYEPGGTVGQLLTDWDRTGSAGASPPTALKASQTSPTTGCDNSLFDTAGTTTARYEKQCSIPNWMHYGFWGTTSLTHDWSTVSGGQHAPTPLGGRPSVCTSLPSYLTAPSCGTGNDRKGDWVETYTGGNAGNNISAPLASAIHQFGQPNEFSNVSCGNGCTYGNALVVMVDLWDCAEQYQGGTWTLIQNKAGTDCADMGGNGNCNAGVPVCWTNGNPTPARLHVFTYAPFTFYEGLVNSSSISGFWGGPFGDPDSCPSSNCALNALSNTTFLVGE